MYVIAHMLILTFLFEDPTHHELTILSSNITIYPININISFQQLVTLQKAMLCMLLILYSDIHPKLILSMVENF